ncbi:MAG TPA: FAD-dependent oxidoreductase [Solirubrobacteraceae bacterium]|nr:FAD-dependent oxidoreductase [Solirubrobacteraceae bacterium]
MSHVLVVGAGVVGLAAAFELTRAGHRVTVLSADVPGARQSAGLTRIFRLSHPDRSLTDAAARSLELWGAWEGLAGGPLLDRVGLVLTGDVSDREVHLRAHGGLRRLSGACHPLAVARDEWWSETTGAAIHAEATVRFLQTRPDRELELELGEAARVDRRGVSLVGGGRIEAERVVVCAGPDTYRLLGLPEPERMRSVRMSFALREPLSSPPPCWIHRDEELCEPFYAVMDGPDHYSVGLSHAAPARVSEAEHVRDAHRRLVEIVRRALPGLRPTVERVIACEFPTRAGPVPAALAHDGWDMPEQAGVLGLAGPSLFKFAPLLGRLVAARVGDAAG